MKDEEGEEEPVWVLERAKEKASTLICSSSNEEGGVA
jgi:hypothetical protein